MESTSSEWAKNPVQGCTLAGSADVIDIECHWLQGQWRHGPELVILLALAHAHGAHTGR
eukprot:CAMPEP_0168453842 /NCGR_PEP_ID=MMETSP0228-20121227/49901_1 /TAXON_ID=133427 /ORGANISM="Protoceratium reticulatum, Strain CCCM 535 (=CCMP 1889)" /LENGTH=58 /DNA_ID=CAMNT_0008468585 /DNA_START=696 /DNA_END=868 /DNA_ORIENTATION=+